MRCKNCGWDNPEHTETCEKCNVSLKKDSPSIQPEYKNESYRFKTYQVCQTCGHCNHNKVDKCPLCKGTVSTQKYVNHGRVCDCPNCGYSTWEEHLYYCPICGEKVTETILMLPEDHYCEGIDLDNADYPHQKFKNGKQNVFSYKDYLIAEHLLHTIYQQEGKEFLFNYIHDLDNRDYFSYKQRLQTKNDEKIILKHNIIQLKTDWVKFEKEIGEIFQHTFVRYLTPPANNPEGTVLGMTAGQFLLFIDHIHYNLNKD